MKKQDFINHNKISHIDYKDIDLLARFLSPSGKILSSKRSGLTRKNQRKVENAVKRSRFMGLMPYINI